MLICGRLILDENPKGYGVAEHIVTKGEENTQILSTLENEKSIRSMNPGELLRHQWLDLWEFKLSWSREK